MTELATFTVGLVQMRSGLSPAANLDAAVSLIVLMGLGGRGELAETLIARGWTTATPAAIVCGASTANEWIWTGTVAELRATELPAGIAGGLKRAPRATLKPERAR